MKPHVLDKFTCPHVGKLTTNVPGLQLVKQLSDLRKRYIEPDIELPVKCRACNQLPHRVFHCAKCTAVGCFKHVLEHLISKRHEMAYCVTMDLFLCGACRGYVFNDQVLRREMTKHNERYRLPLALSKQNQHQQVDMSRFQGLRGLINLGSTCYMNSVLQALIHNPLLRNYYLGLCQVEDPVSTLLKGLVKESYGNCSKPFNPHEFLVLLWRVAPHLSSSRQHDAHEFLMAILNGINRSHICDLVFKGMLRSEVTCSVCGECSVTNDPFYDISLHLKTQYIERGSPMTPTPSHRREIRMQWDKDRILKSVSLCLFKFTNRELLGEQLWCQICEKKRRFYKQLTFQKLPLVLTFHLKRFEQGIGALRKKSTKIDDYIAFPLEMDMFPYSSKYVDGQRITTADVNESNAKDQDDDASLEGLDEIFSLEKGGRKTNNSMATNNFLRNKNPDLEVLRNHRELYSLFAVVQHSGSMESGHYTCYVKHKNRWYFCDDECIYYASTKDILSCQGYILCYVKNKLHYR